MESHQHRQTEVEQLRKKLSDLEMKNARQIHDVRHRAIVTHALLTQTLLQLNKEISELETLIEAKIYREVCATSVC